MKIAVFVDAEGKALPLYESGTVELYNDELGTWSCVKQIPFEVTEDMNLPQIRAAILKMVAEIEDCKVFVAESIKGSPFTIFEGLGICIWKYKGFPVELLDYIREQEDKILQEKLKPKPKPIAIGDIRDGIYKLNLVKAMETDNTISSKQILLPFFQNNTFQELEIICEHMPKWFDREFGALKLKVECKDADDGFCHAIVSPQD